MIMETVRIADEILKKVKLLEKGRGELEEKAIHKANTIMNYDKQLALAIIRLKEEAGLAVSVCEKVAKGECSKFRYEMEVATELYKVVNTKLECIKAELNGLQSVNRHLSEV
jgi:hypothetical protein